MKPPVSKIQMELNRRNYIRAGRKLLQRKNINSLKVQDIVSEAGMAQGSFYNYFESKEGYLTEFIQDVSMGFRIAIRAARLEATNASDFVRKSILATIDVARMNSDIRGLFSKNPYGMRHLYYQSSYFVLSHQELHQDLEEGVKKGYFCPHNVIYLGDILTIMRIDALVKYAQDPEDTERLEKDIEFAVEVLAPYFAAEK